MLKKRLFYILLLLVSTGLILTYCCNRTIANAASGKHFTDVQAIPYNKVGLLLGTSKYGKTGRHNPYYDYRIEAAVALLKAGKIKYLIISGDNSRKEYDEPTDMRRDLINAGIDSTIIYLDYAGFRTFDSVVRLKEIFGQDSVTFISQRFHNERAVYTAAREGVAAVGFNTADVSSAYSFRIQLREKLARVKVMLDFWFGNEPKYLGNKVVIPG